MTTLLEVRDLSTYFFLSEGIVKAVDEVSFTLNPNEVLGIVGETGSGKSVTVKSIMRLVRVPGKIVKGQVLYKGQNLLELSERDMQKIRGKEIAMIFQDPMMSLNPLYTVGDQLMETIVYHMGYDRRKAYMRAVEMLELVGIPEPEKRMNSYPFEFSGGMRQRVVIAIALSCNPSVLIADEPTTALDVTIQAQILELMKELQREFKTGMLYITHNLGVIASIADRVMVMYGGRHVEMGLTDQIFYSPKHPYTKMLLRSVPRVDKRLEKLESIPGQPPRMLDTPPVCPFLPRCPRRLERCFRELPQMVEVGPNHFVRCFNPMD